MPPGAPVGILVQMSDRMGRQRAVPGVKVGLDYVPLRGNDETAYSGRACPGHRSWQSPPLMAGTRSAITMRSLRAGRPKGRCKKFVMTPDAWQYDFSFTQAGPVAGQCLFAMT
jgi:hypothetical protein